LAWDPNDQCVEGSGGPLCAVCSENFVKIGDECKPCQGGADYFAPAMTLLSSCVLVFGITALIICRTHAHKEKKVSELATEVKILVSWLQILSVVSQTFDSVQWPSRFTSASQGANIVNLDLSFLMASAGACKLALPFMGKFVVSAATPFGLILSVKLAEFVGVRCSGTKKEAETEDKQDKEDEIVKEEERLHPAHEKLEAQKSASAKMIITLLLLLYPSIANQAFTMFRCRTVDGLGTKQILEKDYSVECYVGDHAQYLFVAIAAIVVYAVGVPVALYYMLWNNRHHLHDDDGIISNREKEVRSRLGNFFLQYEESFWYFEILVLIFKLTLTGLFCIIARDSPFQVVLAFFVCSVYAMVLLRHTPYLTPDADLLALVTSAALALTLLTGYVVTATNAFLKDQPEKLDESIYVMDIFLIAINALPFAIFIFNLAKRAIIKRCRNSKNEQDPQCRKPKNETKIIPVNDSLSELGLSELENDVASAKEQRKQQQSELEDRARESWSPQTQDSAN